MASAWGTSWGSSWGDSWGTAESVPVEPPTSFPAVVRRLNMLRPARWPYASEVGPGFNSFVTDWSTPADYFKDWVVFNLQAIGGANTDTATFGAFTTAPDGTTDTARLLVDTVANSEHSFLAGWNDVNQRYYGKLRLAGIFKYAGRRIVLSIISQTPSGGYGCKAVFDLLNGQIAVDNAATVDVPTDPWTIYPAGISEVGDGWYLCYIDAICNTSQGGQPNVSLYGKLSLDNGTGTAAQSSTYAGDGTSGVYAWRSNMLPTRAWDLGEVAFFDDFDDPTMANIDLTNGRAEGFDWYINNVFPGYDGGDLAGNGNVPTVPATLSVAGSALTCSSHPQPLFLSSFASQWDVGSPYTQEYVGQGWVPPAIFECRAKWDISQSNLNDAVAFWSTGLEWLVAGRNQDPGALMASREYDFFEALFGGYPRSSMLYYPPGPDPFAPSNKAIGRSSVGVDVWYATATYGAGLSVERLGTYYTALVSTQGNPPESSPTKWGPYVPTVGATLPVGDYANFHDYATLWLPYDEETGEPGQIIQFYDGAMVSFPLTYGPGMTGDVQTDLIHQSDWQQMPVFLGCGPTMGVTVDWVRVTEEGAAPPEPEVVDVTALAYDGGYRRKDYEPERQAERRRKQVALRETVEAAFRAAFGEEPGDEPAMTTPTPMPPPRRAARAILPAIRTAGLNAPINRIEALVRDYQAALVAERRAQRRKREEETMLVLMTVH